MAKKNKYENLANCVIDLVGGKENVVFFTHCITRLRFNVKDKSLVKKENIEEIEGVMGCQWSSDQLQIIIGQSVGDAYQLICDKTGLTQQDSIDENLDGRKEKKKLSLTAVFDAIAACMTPLLPCLIGAGFVKIILLVAEMTGLLATTSSSYVVLNFVGDAGFYFLPVFVGATAAKKFNVNISLGMLIGAMFIHPNFIAAVTEGTALDIAGIPIYSASYTSTIFPALLSVWVMAPIERFFAKHSPDVIRSITEPLLTLLVMIPLALCVLGPIGSFLGIYISELIVWLYNLTGFLGVGILAAFMPLLIMTGMHSSLFPYSVNAMVTLGYEAIVGTSMIISNLDQAAASAAVAFKTKNKNIKSLASGCAVTAFFGGVTEPAMYGVNMKYKTPLYASMIGSFVGGCVAGFGKAAMYAMSGTGGIFVLPVYLPGGTANLVWMVVGIVVGMIVTFILTLLLYKENEIQ